MKFLKIKFIGLDKFIKSKRVLKSSVSLFWSYLFLIWYLIKPSRIISDINGNFLYKIILYLYEILPLFSYLILIINTGIQLRFVRAKIPNKLLLIRFPSIKNSNIESLAFILKFN